MSTTRIKICGISTVEDARLAARLGADAIGLNFWRSSKRAVDVPVAQQILDELPPFVDPVGLFVNEPLITAAAFLQQFCNVRTLQWHGNEPEIQPAEGWYRYIPAFAVADAGSLARVKTFLERCRLAGRLPAAVLLDGHATGQYGGTGQLAPWRLIADFNAGVPVILAGGLTADNVAEAIRMVRPYAVDVAGGVESEPGCKDADKLRRFVDAVRSC
jgi:phosphoribosylanthranilate isomerase